MYYGIRDDVLKGIKRKASKTFFLYCLLSFFVISLWKFQVIDLYMFVYGMCVTFLSVMEDFVQIVIDEIFNYATE